MKNDYAKYLLRTERQLQEFRSEFAGFISGHEAEYIRWVRSFPLCVWIRYLNGVPEENVRGVVGMICHLYCSGKINISFHESMMLLRREPESLEEWREWCESFRGRIVLSFNNQKAQ